MTFFDKFRRTLRSALPHAVFLFVCYAVQSLVLPYIPPLRVLPLILPCAVVGVAVFEGVTAGGLFGLAAGIACDVSYLQPLRQFTILLTLTGLRAGLLADTVLARGFPTYISVCIIALLIIAVIQLFPLILFTLTPPRGLIVTALRQTVFSLLFALPLYFFAAKLGARRSGAPGQKGPAL
jgi:hypothetical protein